MVNQLQRVQLLAQRALIRLKWTHTLPISATPDRSILNDGRFVLLSRGAHANSPTLDVVGSTRVDLHEIPVIACEVFTHCLRQPLRTPLAFKVVPPHTCRNSIYRFISQTGIYTFLLIQRSFLPFLF